MKPVQRLIPWFAMALIAGLIWFFRPAPSEDASEEPLEAVGKPHRRRIESGLPSAAVQEERDDSAEDSTPADMVRLIDRSLAQFRDSPGTVESSAILRELRNGIRSSNPECAADAIVVFLKSGEDAATRLPFVVGPGGVMESTPTLRTALLDLLPSLDPTLALGVARGVMDSKKSPDEFALALRNLAWNDLDGDSKGELSERLKQMIEMDDWLKNPSAGFLEALDSAVEISDEHSFAAMLRLSVGEIPERNPALVRASFMALDRMVIRDPSMLMNSFAADSGMAGISPDQRASLMSRLDLADPAQRDSLSRYLSETPLGEGELDYFAELFPNGNYLHGNWLITSLDSTQSINDRLETDRKVLVELDRMIAENPDKQANQAIVRIRERLRKMAETKPNK